MALQENVKPLVPAVIAWKVGAATTMIVKLRAALKAGVPLSVTRTVTGLVVPAWTAVALHANNPVAGSMIAPAGNPGSRQKARVYAGTSLSEAMLVSRSVVPAWMI